MKTIFTFAFLLTFFSYSSAQTDYSESYKIIFQLTTNDTMAHKALLKQLTNITSVSPQTQIEVVCHGPGLTFLQAEKSIATKRFAEFTKKGITFSACEFSMKERKVKKEEIVVEAGYVEAGILHIVSRQSKGWFYIKAGF
jgi:intracellular sulfur oxidation DsrE/DsrF family protein